MPAQIILLPEQSCSNLGNATVMGETQYCVGDTFVSVTDIEHPGISI